MSRPEDRTTSTVEGAAGYEEWRARGGSAERHDPCRLACPSIEAVDLDERADDCDDPPPGEWRRLRAVGRAEGWGRA